MKADERQKHELAQQRWRTGKPSASKTIQLCRAVLELRELNRAEYFYGDELWFEFDAYGYLQKINPNPTIVVDPANYFVGLKNLIPFPAHLKPRQSREKVRELKKERGQFLAISEIAKTGNTSVRINNVRYDGYDAIKKRLDEINGQLAL